MFATIAGILSSKEGQIAVAVAAMLALNALLTGLKKALDHIKDKTETKLDDEAAEVVGKALNIGSKILEFLTANSAALPPKAKIQLEEAQAEISKLKEVQNIPVK